MVRYSVMLSLLVIAPLAHAMRQQSAKVAPQEEIKIHHAETQQGDTKRKMAWDVQTAVPTNKKTETVADKQLNDGLAIMFGLPSDHADLQGLPQGLQCLVFGYLKETGIKEIKHDEPICDSQLSPDGSLLATIEGLRAGSWRHEIYMWDIETGKVQWIYKRPSDGLHFSADGKRIVAQVVNDSYDWEPTAFAVLDVATGECVRQFNLDGHFHGRALSSDGSLFAVSSFEKGVHLFDVATGKLKLIFKGQSGSCWPIEFSSDDRYVRACFFNPERITCIWDVATGELTPDAARAFWPVPPAIFADDADAVRSKGKMLVKNIRELLPGKFEKYVAAHPQEVAAFAQQDCFKRLVIKTPTLKLEAPQHSAAPAQAQIMSEVRQPLSALAPVIIKKSYWQKKKDAFIAWLKK